VSSTAPLPAGNPAGLLPDLLERAIRRRVPLFNNPHHSALRLFNGFTEGHPELSVDLYGATAVLHDYREAAAEGPDFIPTVQEVLQANLPWLQAAILKSRNSPDAGERRGRLLFGTAPDQKVQEDGVWYAIDLRMNRDASLYLDTRGLRQWATRSLGGRSVLNTFAYTGSLGVAALAGGASRVVQVDRNRTFLNLAKDSYTLNGFPIHKADFVTGDFWVQVSRLKRAGERFDCVIVDPPFFSTTARGELDLNRDSARLINKVRPLVNDGGRLAAVNNALYVSGREYLHTLEELCADGYLKIAELIPVPEDFTGFDDTRRGTFITDPAPFNHPTKIAVLEVRRKTGHSSTDRG
jgi:23S rRNA (cytosine1962-C5)-methyltransferase